MRRGGPPDDEDFFEGPTGWDEPGSDEPTAVVRPPRREERPPSSRRPQRRTLADDVSRLAGRFRAGDRPPWPWVLLGVGAVLVVLLAGILWITGGDELEELPAETPIATGIDTGAAVDTGPATTGAAGGGAGTVEPLPEDVTLRGGDSGPAVERLQLALTALGFDLGEPDGVYGARTTAAVSAFQADAGLEADGVVGPATARAVNEALAGTG